MNQNDLAVLIAKKEGKKKSVDIAQIKEVIRLYNEAILYLTGIDIAEVLRKVR